MGAPSTSASLVLFLCLLAFSGRRGLAQGPFSCRLPLPCGQTVDTSRVAFDISNSDFTAIRGESSNRIGVEGRSAGSTGVSGFSDSGNFGVSGTTNNPRGSGVFGSASGPQSTGVRGIAANGTGLVGSGAVGVRGVSRNGRGVFGLDSGAGVGVIGVGNFRGVLGTVGDISCSGKFGVGGCGGSEGDGVVGRSEGRGVIGVTGQGSCATRSPGVLGYGVGGCSVDGDGVLGRSTNGYAGFFAGNVLVTGSIKGSSAGFTIDHPVNPQERYLSHAAVHSDEMKDIYDGITLLDEDGAATVQLPDWFEALNGDFRYQLTPLGGPAPDLYIAAEIQDNAFAVAGGMPGLKVSWQVTGTRKDVYANAHRISVEESKPESERSRYLHPTHHGAPMERSIDSGAIQ